MKVLIVMLMLWTIILTGCPKAAQTTALRQAAKADYQLAGLTLDAINATQKAVDNGTISADLGKKFAVVFQQVVNGGKRFNQELDAINASQKGDVVAPSKLANLNLIFSTEIVTPFLGLMDDMKLIPSVAGGYLLTAINAVRLAILQISGAFTHAGYNSGAGGLNNAKV